MGGQVELFWPHFGYFLVSCFRDRFRSDFRSLLAPFWEPCWVRKTTKTIGGLLKIRISALPRRRPFRDPSRPRFGVVLAPKMELKSLPRRLPKRPRKRYPKGTPSRGENEPQDPPGTPQNGPKSAPRAPGVRLNRARPAAALGHSHSYNSPGKVIRVTSSADRRAQD